VTPPFYAREQTLIFRLSGPMPCNGDNAPSARDTGPAGLLHTDASAACDDADDATVAFVTATELHGSTSVMLCRSSSRRRWPSRRAAHRQAGHVLAAFSDVKRQPPRAFSPMPGDAGVPRWGDVGDGGPLKRRAFRIAN
jgi:hypothetical protein